MVGKIKYYVSHSKAVRVILGSETHCHITDHGKLSSHGDSLSKICVFGYIRYRRDVGNASKFSITGLTKLE